MYGMKKLHRNLIHSINLLLTSMIAALGVVGCSHQKNVAKQQDSEADNEQQNALEEAPQKISREEMVCMYGVPRAQYFVKGKVEDPNGDPLAEKELTVKAGRDILHIKTNETGNFEANFEGFPAEEITFVIDGVDYTRKITYDGEPVDSWNRGAATIDVQITHDTEQVTSRPQRPIMVKYGVPPTRIQK